MDKKKKLTFDEELYDYNRDGELDSFERMEREHYIYEDARRWEEFLNEKEREKQNAALGNTAGQSTSGKNKAAWIIYADEDSSNRIPGNSEEFHRKMDEYMKELEKEEAEDRKYVRRAGLIFLAILLLAVWGMVEYNSCKHPGCLKSRQPGELYCSMHVHLYQEETKRTCEVPSCQNVPIHGTPYCIIHTCVVENCDELVYMNHLCYKHYTEKRQSKVSPHRRE